MDFRDTSRELRYIISLGVLAFLLMHFWIGSHVWFQGGREIILWTQGMIFLKPIMILLGLTAFLISITYTYKERASNFQRFWPNLTLLMALLSLTFICIYSFSQYDDILHKAGVPSFENGWTIYPPLSALAESESEIGFAELARNGQLESFLHWRQRILASLLVVLSLFILILSHRSLKAWRLRRV